MKKRILGCLTMLCVISVILTGCRNQRQGADDLQKRESSSLAMAEENAMNREVGAHRGQEIRRGQEVRRIQKTRSEPLERRRRAM